MRPRRVPALVGAAVLAASVSACGDGEAAGDDAGLTVVATTTQVADFARAVAGDRARVIPLLGPNVDPHDFEPSPKEVKEVGEADVVVSNGVGLESWLADTIDGSGFDGTRVDASRGVSLRHGEDGSPDPHIWHNPRNALIMVRTVADALCEADPAGRADYEAALTAYEARLAALDADTAARIATIPPSNRKLVTNHDSLGYYADRYGLRVIGSVIPSFDSSAELSKDGIDSIVSRIKAEKVPAVFAESSLRPDEARTIASEAGVSVVTGEDSLYTDSLGPPGSPAATYLDMIRHNTDVIVGALS